MRRPAADLTTTLGIASVVASLCALVVIVALHSPSAAAIAALFSGGVALIGVLERPSVQSVTVTAREPVTVQGSPVLVEPQHQQEHS